MNSYYVEIYTRELEVYAYPIKASTKDSAFNTAINRYCNLGGNKYNIREVTVRKVMGNEVVMHVVNRIIKKRG